MDSSSAVLKQIFSQALDYPAGPKRSAYLEQACGTNLDLRDRVEALLRTHDDAGSFLKSNPDLEALSGEDPVLALLPSTASAGDAGVTQRSGTMIGPYKLLQKIGEGGMGVVFMAEQEKPIRRKVALKVIKPGMDTRQVIARFEAERQALAMMDHPNIARVLDGGATNTDRPFFVMELVRGVPITDYCDRNHLNPRERLELFLPICRAIQHAHQKGIIHRDIKPSNVLVTLHDGMPVPKVIDFGVAKAIEQRLTERTMFTEFGAVLGTLEYMSPEQAEMGALDIDTRSDIYSLGVLLYELLTGSTPLERAKVRAASYTEILRRVRDEDPPRPSTRLSHSNSALASISAQRRTEPAQLSRLIRGELDWIVMKSLEKDRTRRYESATSFARDLRRYLDGDIVEANPPSTLYRLQKLARKHRKVLAWLASFGALLIAATITSASLAIWANRERLRATRAEERALRLQDRAEQGEQTAIAAVKQFTEVFRNAPELKANPALVSLRRQILQEPSKYFRELRDRLHQDSDRNPAILARLADACYELGDLSGESGNKDTAVAAFEEARQLWEQLAQHNPNDRRAWSELARCDFQLGYKYQDFGRPVDALARFEESRQIRERLLSPDPARASVADQLSLGRTDHEIGKLQLWLKHPDLALLDFEKALPIWRRLVQDDPESIRFQGDLTYALTNIGQLRHDDQRLIEAVEAYQKARPIRLRRTREQPRSIEVLLDRATNDANLATLQASLGREPEALATFQDVLPIWRTLIELDPANPRYLPDLGWHTFEVGNLQTKLGKPTEARQAYTEARAIFQKLNEDYPANPGHVCGIAQCRSGLAGLDEQVGNLEAARLGLREGIKTLESNLAAHPDHLNSQIALRDQLADLARVATRMGQDEEATTARRKLDQLAPVPMAGSP